MFLARWVKQRQENSLFKARNMIKQLMVMTDNAEKEKVHSYFTARSL